MDDLATHIPRRERHAEGSTISGTASLITMAISSFQSTAVTEISSSQHSRTIRPSATTTNNHGRYIYDFYSDIDVIRGLVSCVSLIFLATAIFFWCAVWRGNPGGSHPYRFASFIGILAHSFIYHLVSLIGLLAYIPDGVGCQFILTLKSYGDIGMYIFFFVFVILCIGVAMRRLESGSHFYLLIILSMILPLIVVTVTTTFRVLRNSNEACNLLDELSHAFWFDRAPKSFLLFGTICVLSVLLYWLFCFDNSQMKTKRDFLLMQHSSVTLMILVCFCFFLELYEVVFINNSPDGHVKSKGLARNGLIISILMCAKGLFASFLLCFFDIEVLTMMFSLPCWRNLDDAVDDRKWETRIRSESKVKFFEESSSDENTRTPGTDIEHKNPFKKDENTRTSSTDIEHKNPFKKDENTRTSGTDIERKNPFKKEEEESDRVLPSTNRVQRYGSLEKE